MPTSTLLVMCGDDKRRESFVSALSGAGWQGVLSAPSMAEATKVARHATNICAIVDAELTDIPGLSAVAILRNLWPQAKIIFTTPENTREMEAEGRAMGVFYYYLSSADATVRNGESPSLRGASRAELLKAVTEAIGAPRPRGIGRPPKVLIVDDDPAFHDAVRMILSSAGYCTCSAYSEREGLESARRETPDLILLDIIMASTTDGFEFCHEAKRDPHIKHTPILGVSAIEERLARHCAPDRDPELFPVDGYLQKPVAAGRLLAELKRLIPAEV